MSQQKGRDPDDLDKYKDRIERIVEERRELFDRLAAHRFPAPASSLGAEGSNDGFRVSGG